MALTMHSMIRSVAQDSPAFRANLFPSDVVRKVSGLNVIDSSFSKVVDIIKVRLDLAKLRLTFLSMWLRIYCLKWRQTESYLLSLR